MGVPFDFAAGRITGEPYPITDGSTGEVEFDGSKVAYRAVRAGRYELWERSIIEGQQRLLLSSQHWRLIKPRWSADGARLAFSRYAVRNGRLAVAVLTLDGSGELVVTEPGDVDMPAFDWSSDGRAILGACHAAAADGAEPRPPGRMGPQHAVIEDQVECDGPARIRRRWPCRCPAGRMCSGRL